MVDDNEQHGQRAKKYGERIEVIVGDHCEDGTLIDASIGFVGSRDVVIRRNLLLELSALIK